MDIHDKIKDLLLSLSKKAYEEGRRHEAEEAENFLQPIGILNMKSFEDTKVYKDIMENYKP